MKSTARGGAKINGEEKYKIGTYSFRSMKYKQNKKDDANRIQQDKGTVYYSCRNTINRKIRKDKPNCPAQNSKCYKCQHMGHFSKFCKSMAEIKKVDENR